MKKTIFILLPIIFFIITSCARLQIKRSVENNIFHSSSHPKAIIEISPDFKYSNNVRSNKKDTYSNTDELLFRNERGLTNYDNYFFPSRNSKNKLLKFINLKFTSYQDDFIFLHPYKKEKHFLEFGNTELNGNSYQYFIRAVNYKRRDTAIRGQKCFLAKIIARTIKTSRMEIEYAEHINYNSDYHFKCSDWNGSSPLTEIQKARLREFKDRSERSYIITSGTVTVPQEDQKNDRETIWEDKMKSASSPVFWFDKAYKFYWSREYEEAIEHFNKAIELEPGYAKAYNYRGRAYHFLKDYNQAISSFIKAYEIFPSYESAYNNLGITYKTMEDYENAIKSYKKSIAVNPEYKHSYNNLGWVYYKLGNYQESIDNYNKALERDPKYISPYNNLGIVYIELGDYEKAMKNLNRVTEMNPKYRYAYVNRARIHSLQKQTDKACMSLEESIAKGYKNWKWIKGEKDFDNIREADCYKKLMSDK